MDEIKLPINLAVYGTLKKKYGNHYLLKESEFLGEVLLPNMRCYMGNSFPMAWHDWDSKQSLKCEVYNIVNPKVLDQLHSLEGHPDFFECVKHPSMDIWFYQCNLNESMVAQANRNLRDESQIMEWSRT